MGEMVVNISIGSEFTPNVKRFGLSQAVWVVFLRFRSRYFGRSDVSESLLSHPLGIAVLQ